MKTSSTLTRGPRGAFSWPARGVEGCCLRATTTKCRGRRALETRKPTRAVQWVKAREPSVLRHQKPEALPTPQEGLPCHHYHGSVLYFFLLLLFLQARAKPWRAARLRREVTHGRSRLDTVESVGAEDIVSIKRDTNGKR
jgi:hypothetical protein